jgi:phosphate starvation-inducible membrane PsiE
MNEAIIIFGGIVLSFGIGALIIDYFQHKFHQEK